MWAEQGISRLLFNIVLTDIDAFVPLFHQLEEPLLVKVGVLGMDECPYGFISDDTEPFECPPQSREKL
jgi:hypothetical protein